MRILILANNDVGLFKFRRELLAELVKVHEVYICLPYGGFVPDMEAMGCKFVACEFERRGTNPVKELQLISFYRKTVRSIRPDIVFTYTIKPNIYGGMACASLGIPYVVNVTGLGTAVENPGLMQKVSLTLYKLGLRKAQKVFFQNTENRDFMLKHGVVKGAYDLLPGSGVNLEQYSPLEYPQGNTVDFLFIARVMKEKGIDLYLAAAKRIRNNWSNAVFHICGGCDDEAYKEILKREHNAGTIVYHGLQKNMAPFYAMANCVVHPSYYPEGMSNVLLEAAASARPIIATDRSGCRETVNDGETGYLIPIRDEDALVKALESIMVLSWEERRNMGLKGREKIEREFDRKIVVQMYLDEVRSCIDNEAVYGL